MPNNIVIRDATKLNEAYRFAHRNGQGAEFDSRFMQLLSLITAYAPAEAPPRSVVKLEVGMDGAPYSFVAYSGIQTEGEGWKRGITAGLIRHTLGDATSPRYEWSIHT